MVYLRVSLLVLFGLQDKEHKTFTVVYYSASTLRSSRSRVFCKKSYRLLKRVPAQVFSCDFCKSFQSSAFGGHLRGTASVHSRIFTGLLKISYSSNRSCRSEATNQLSVTRTRKGPRNLFKIEKDREKAFQNREKP